MRMLPVFVAAAAALAFYAFGDPWADSVTSITPGNGPIIGTSTHMLGPPEGAGMFEGSFHILSPGAGGAVVLHLATGCLDGPGADLVVSENPFYIVGTPNLFIEAMFVEVSTDGSVWARFPTSFTGPPGPYLPTAGGDPAAYKGFAGLLPVVANSVNALNVLDVVDAGGDAFDLRDLADDPQVVAGNVHLGDINYVRLIDVDAGSQQDDQGVVIWDNGLNNVAAADIDAVTTPNDFVNVVIGRPAVEMDLAGGFLTISFEDLDGFKDIKTGLKASANGVPVDFYSLLSAFVVTEFSPTRLTLFTGPIPPGVFPVIFKVAAVDKSGMRCGDAITIQ